MSSASRRLSLLESEVYVKAVNSNSPAIMSVVAKYHGALEGSELSAAKKRLADLQFKSGHYIPAALAYLSLGLIRKAVHCAKKLNDSDRFDDARNVRLHIDLKRADQLVNDGKLARAARLYVK